MKLKCPRCKSTKMVKAGINHYKSGDAQRYQCQKCYRITTKPKR